MSHYPIEWHYWLVRASYMWCPNILSRQKIYRALNFQWKLYSTVECSTKYFLMYSEYDILCVSCLFVESLKLIEFIFFPVMAFHVCRPFSSIEHMVLFKYVLFIWQIDDLLNWVSVPCIFWYWDASKPNALAVYLSDYSQFP